MAPNESRQMEMLLEEGGLTDDGTTRDPVSGNEVPPGSMAEEVRDDVPAQLSEGEYVVPADVVRFYGVRFFEDLRGQAKQGLMDMEANGRIGGEPVAQTMDNQTGGELTPEELAALEQITGMAMGGVVPPANPYLQQQQMYQQPVPAAMNNSGNTLYASDGVDVSSGSNVDPYTAQFTDQTAAAFGPGFLIDQTLGTTSSDIRTVIMYGPNGEVETVTLPAQQARYDELLAMSYSETPVTTTTETTVGVEDSEGDRGGPDTTGQPTQGATPIGEMSDEQLASSAKGLSLVGAIGTAVLGPTAGTALQAVGAARYNDIIDEMTVRGLDTEGMDRMGSIFGGEGGIYEGLADTDGKKGATFGDTWLGDLLGFDGKMGVAEDAPGLRESFRGARRTGGDDDGDRQPTGGTSSTSTSDTSPDTSTAAQEASDAGFGDTQGGEFGGTGSTGSGSNARGGGLEGLGYI